MKYLAYFQPNKELSDLILKQKHLALPSSGLHSTLCFFHMEPEHENKLITDLSQINFNPLKIKTLGYDNFDKNSLVIKLSNSNELLQLHKKILSVVRNYAPLGLGTSSKQYLGDDYNPHLTISKSSSKFDRNSKELIDRKDRITKYTLTKKIDGNWRKIQDFYSAE